MDISNYSSNLDHDKARDHMNIIKHMAHKVANFVLAYSQTDVNREIFIHLSEGFILEVNDGRKTSSDSKEAGNLHLHKLM